MAETRALTMHQRAVSVEALSEVAVRSRSVSLAVRDSTWTCDRLEGELRVIEADLARVRRELESQLTSVN